MRALLPTSFFVLTSCTSGIPEVADESCATPRHETYSGVALALPTGTATFATDNPYCAFVVTGNDVLHHEVFAAWKRSPYEGDIRPIYISVDGQIIPRERTELAPWFRVTNVRDVSVRFSREQAQVAFKLRMARDLPAYRTKAAKNDPQERIRLTD